MKNTFLILIIILFFSGCAIPVMNLKHNPKNTTLKYDKSFGELKIAIFEDKRHPREKLEIDYATHGSTKIWTRRTNPTMNEYIQTIMKSQINQSGLFSVADEGEYLLSGRLISVKNLHKGGAGRKTGGILAGSAIGLSTLSLLAYFNAGIGLSIALLSSGVVVSLSSKDVIMTQVTFDAELTHNDIVIWKDTVNLSVNQKYYLRFKSAKHRSRISSDVLDNNLTLAVRSMIESICSELNHL